MTRDLPVFKHAQYPGWIAGLVDPGYFFVLRLYWGLVQVNPGYFGRVMGVLLTFQFYTVGLSAQHFVLEFPHVVHYIAPKYYTMLYNAQKLYYAI